MTEPSRCVTRLGVGYEEKTGIKYRFWFLARAMRIGYDSIRYKDGETIDGNGGYKVLLDLVS